MSENITSLPKKNITLDVKNRAGILELYRHGLGQGGISPKPLTENVVQAVRMTKPRLIRIFIQEFFEIYPSHGKFKWGKLDAYMKTLDETGAKVVASITLKPPVLFPKIDHTIFMPNNIEEFQNVIYQLVKRYSVEKKIITHWEILNETDIGELGGAPYLITGADDYLKFYRMVSQPILKAFPKAKIGGAAVANTDRDLLYEFIEKCGKTGTQLDFITWHTYSNLPEHHVNVIRKVKDAAKKFPGSPEFMVTEWNKAFDPVSVEELAFDRKKAAITAAAIIAMNDVAPVWSFYYHIQEQVVCPEDFKPFFKDINTMAEFWNEIPIRFGLFGLNDEIRPPYFVYLFLSMMAGERIEAVSDDPDIRTISGCDDDKISVLATNYNPEGSKDVVLQINLKNLPGVFRNLRVYRVDSNYRQLRLNAKDICPKKKARTKTKDISAVKAIEPLSVENREIYTMGDYYCQVYLPADSVAFVVLKK